MTYTIAVCTVKNSWWWTDELSETCRVLSQMRTQQIYNALHVSLCQTNLTVTEMWTQEIYNALHISVCQTNLTVIEMWTQQIYNALHVSLCQTNLTVTEMWTQQIYNALHVSALPECHHHRLNLCSHFSACKVGVINWILRHTRFYSVNIIFLSYRRLSKNGIPVSKHVAVWYLSWVVFCYYMNLLVGILTVRNTSCSWQIPLELSRNGLPLEAIP